MDNYDEQEKNEENEEKVVDEEKEEGEIEGENDENDDDDDVIDENNMDDDGYYDDDGDDEGYKEEDNEDDDEDEDNETLKELLYKHLLHLRDKKKKQRQEGGGKTNFVTFLKKYLKLNIEQRAQRLTDKHVFDFMKLSKAIINKKIKMNISESDLDVLKELVQPETRADERKIVLIEDIRLKVIFKKALGILEEHLKDEERNSAKKTSNARRKQFSQTVEFNDKKSRRQRHSAKRH